MFSVLSVAILRKGHMSDLLYFIEKENGVISRDDLVKAGLNGPIDPARAMLPGRGVTSGPNGMNGAIFNFRPEDPMAQSSMVGYWPERQTWYKANKGRYWIGFENENPVRPQDLARENILPGHYIYLEDGNPWLIPVARHFAEGCALPKSIFLNDVGELTEDTLPKYFELSRFAERIFENFCTNTGIVDETLMGYGYTGDGFEENPADITFVDLIEWCSKALSLNYRISKWEVSALRLFSTESARLTARAIIDWPRIEKILNDLAKKNLAETPAGSVTADGEEAN